MKNTIQKLVLTAGIMFALAMASCAGGKKAASGDYFADQRDKQKYRKVKIGKQTWMAENLNIKIMGDGEYSGSWCYNGDAANCDKYGRLYDYKTAIKACPSGWHLPSREEWSEMLEAVAKQIGLTGDLSAGGNVDRNSVIELAVGPELKAKDAWQTRGEFADKFGFSALPGGYKSEYEGHKSIGFAAYWLTSTKSGWNEAVYCRFYKSSYDDSRIYEDNKCEAASVRCVKD